MKFFDKTGIQLRSTRNKIRSFFRTAPIGTSSLSCNPIMITVRMDDLDIPGSMGNISDATPTEKKKNTSWIIDELSSCFAIFGKLPVHILFLEYHQTHQIQEIFFFLKRLGIPTTLSISHFDTNTSLDFLQELDLHGLYFHFWGTKEETLQRTCPNRKFTVAEHISSFLEISRLQLNNPCRVLIPWLEGITEDIQDISLLTRNSSFTSIELCAPYFSQHVEHNTKINDYKEIVGNLDTTSFNTFIKLRDMCQDRSVGPGKTPNFTYSCPVGGNRLEISRFQKRSHCPFYPIEISTEKDQSLSDWIVSSQRNSHCTKIANCKRSCWHHELRPLGNAFHR